MHCLVSYILFHVSGLALALLGITCPPRFESFSFIYHSLSPTSSLVSEKALAPVYCAAVSATESVLDPIIPPSLLPVVLCSDATLPSLIDATVGVHETDLALAGLDAGHSCHNASIDTESLVSRPVVGSQCG
jgi:hypothetical protein